MLASTSLSSCISVSWVSLSRDVIWLTMTLLFSLCIATPRMSFTKNSTSSLS